MSSLRPEDRVEVRDTPKNTVPDDIVFIPSGTVFLKAGALFAPLGHHGSEWDG